MRYISLSDLNEATSCQVEGRLGEARSCYLKGIEVDLIAIEEAKKKQGSGARRWRKKKQSKSCHCYIAVAQMDAFRGLDDDARSCFMEGASVCLDCSALFLEVIHE